MRPPRLRVRSPPDVTVGQVSQACHREPTLKVRDSGGSQKTADRGSSVGRNMTMAVRINRLAHVGAKGRALRARAACNVNVSVASNLDCAVGHGLFGIRRGTPSRFSSHRLIPALFLSDSLHRRSAVRSRSGGRLIASDPKRVVPALSIEL